MESEPWRDRSWHRVTVGCLSDDCSCCCGESVFRQCFPSGASVVLSLRLMACRNSGGKPFCRWPAGLLFGGLADSRMFFSAFCVQLYTIIIYITPGRLWFQVGIVSLPGRLIVGFHGRGGSWQDKPTDRLPANERNRTESDMNVMKCRTGRSHGRLGIKVSFSVIWMMNSKDISARYRTYLRERFCRRAGFMRQKGRVWEAKGLVLFYKRTCFAVEMTIYRLSDSCSFLAWWCLCSWQIGTCPDVPAALSVIFRGAHSCLYHHCRR